MKIKGMTAIITGASSGIGRAVAVALARRGARVALVARRADLLQEVAAAIQEFGGEAVVAPCDVSDRQSVRASLVDIEAAVGSPDILINAAGCATWMNFLDIDESDHQRMMDVNYWGTFHWIRATLPALLSKRRGSIVNISSGSGKFALAVTSGYSASKFAVAGLSESLRRELSGSGVQVCCFFPGSVRTPFWTESSIATELVPAIVRFAPRMSPEAVARHVCLAIRLGLAERTLPVFVAFVARLNALWCRAGDFLLWKWAFPLIALLLFGRYVLAR